MTCPSCNQPASSFLRDAFSFQGVSFFKNIRGYLKCQHCGSLLRVTGFGKPFWPFFIAAVILLGLWIALYETNSTFLGLDVGTMWIFFGLWIVITFRFGVWKHSQVEAVGPDGSTPNERST